MKQFSNNVKNKSFVLLQKFSILHVSNSSERLNCYGYYYITFIWLVQHTPRYMQAIYDLFCFAEFMNWYILPYSDYFSGNEYTCPVPVAQP